MSAQTITDVGIYVNQYDLSALAAGIDFSATAATPDMNNCAGGGYEHLLAGLASGSLTINNGLLDYATPGSFAAFSGSVRGRTDVVGIVPNTITATTGSPAFFAQGVLANYASPKGGVGDTARYSAEWHSQGSSVITGVVGAPLANRTGSLTGGSVQLGAVGNNPVGAPERLWAAMFVLAAAGTNLAVTIQTDNATGFPSPATGITFPTVSAVGAQFAFVNGPLTDDWFRVTSTTGSGNFTYLVLMGVQ